MVKHKFFELNIKPNKDGAIYKYDLMDRKVWVAIIKNIYTRTSHYYNLNTPTSMGLFRILINIALIKQIRTDYCYVIDLGEFSKIYMGGIYEFCRIDFNARICKYFNL